MNFMFEWQEHYLTSEHGEQVRYCSCQETYWWQHFWLFSEDFWSLSKDFPKLFRGPDKRSQTFSENFQRFPKIRVEICAWHRFLLTLETTLIKLQRCFDQITSAFTRFFTKPTERQLSNGSQFCMCYASKNITNSRCAWLREGFVNVHASRKSLEKITILVNNCRMVRVYTMAKLVRVLHKFGIVVSNPNCPFMFFY